MQNCIIGGIMQETMKKIEKFALIVILLLAFILRFWHYDIRYGISSDGGRDAIVSFESARQLQLPLTGSFSSIGPITFGPWYYYYITLANFLVPSPWAPWMAIGLASLAMVLVMYKIGTLLLNKYFGLILSFIAAVSPAQILSSTLLQQHALIGFLASLSIYLFLKILKANNFFRLALLWGFVLGVAVNTHFQAVGLLTLPFLLFIFSKKKKFIFPLSLGLFFSLIPILFFELNNHWFNTRNIIDYIFIGQYRVWTSNRWLTFAGKFIPEFWSYVIGTPFIISFILMIGTILVFAIKFFQKKLPLSLFMISISFAVQVIILRYYRGEKFFGYLQFFHPFLFIFTGYLIFLLLRRINHFLFTFFLLLIYFLLIIPNSMKFMAVDKFNNETRQRFNTLINTYPQTKFSTYECKKVYDGDRIQGLLLFLYMHKLYDEKGVKVAINNPSCNFENGKILSNDLVDISSLEDKQISTQNLVQLTPLHIYSDTARWWFKEQP